MSIDDYYGMMTNYLSVGPKWYEFVMSYKYLYKH